MKHLFSSFVAFCIFASLFNSGQSATEPNCIIYNDNGKELTEYDWESGIEIGQIDDVTPYRTIIKTFKTTNITYVYSYEVNGKYSYLKAEESSSKDEIYIEVSNRFDEYEEYETEVTMPFTVEFVCENGKHRELLIRVPIRDTNNHSPKFLRSNYEYKLAMPLPKGFDFDSFNQIVARDVDITNNAINFELKGATDKYTKGLIITGLEHTKEDKKNYPARFKTSMTLDFEEDTTFTLLATDSGEPTLITETNLTIIVDKGNSFPRFAEVVYVADLTDLKYEKIDNLLLRFTDDKNITLDRGYERPVDFSLSGLSDENKEHFKVSSSGPDVFIELSNLSDKFVSQGVINAVLTATKETAQANTAILVLLPEVAKNTNESENAVQEPSTEDDSVNGYMISTIILSLTSVGLLGYIIYLYLYRR